MHSKLPLLLFASLLLGLCGNAAASAAPLDAWQHSGSMYILTTPEGANLPATAIVENFPLLVRLHKDYFDFSQAKPGGEDLRFTSSTGEPLAYQIDQWNAAQGVASIWVRIPRIEGNTQQELKLHWGNPDAASQSSPTAVFNASNGYLAVWHMNDDAQDAVGALSTTDRGTTATAGMVGPARHFPGQKGIFCGDKIAGFPTGAASHSSQAWFRAAQPNGRVLAWGNEHAQGKVIMHFVSPPHVEMECYFSGANVKGETPIALGDWAHVVHTYEKGDSRVYVNGSLAGVTTTADAPLAIKNPARMWIGGWYDNYDFVGDIDEVRISQVVRSADWIKLEYENQKPVQTLVGPIVQTGDEFSVSQSQVTVTEGQSVELIGHAGGARQIYWVIQPDAQGGEQKPGQATIVASDRFSFTYAAGRVTANQQVTLQFKAVYESEAKTKNIAITVQEAISEPAFILHAPATWDGRAPLEVTTELTNLEELQNKGADKLTYTWNVAGMAVIKETRPGKLLLKRALNSGPLTVSVAIDNGGEKTVHSATILVTEPARDAWVQRVPQAAEQPEDNQFFARDDQNAGTLLYRGTLKQSADAVFLRVYADDKLFHNQSGKPTADNSYNLSARLKPGLVQYRTEFGTKVGKTETVLHTAANLVCGDAYLIDGQSNAEATDIGQNTSTFTSPWIRSYGSTSGSPDGARLARWGEAVVRDQNGGKLQIGYWGMELARQLSSEHKMPICILNGAVGGTRIDQHQRNPADPTDVTTIYGRLLWRARQAKLTHGIRAVLWHQGENDQGADGPTGGYGWQTYRQFFVDMAAAWKADYPNIEDYYMFQIWPHACSMGSGGSDNRLREVQRRLPADFSNLSVMSTLGIKPPGGCHYPVEGYAEFARLIGPLLERDFYGAMPQGSITAANLRRAWFTSERRDELTLEFDQNIDWAEALIDQFYLGGQAKQVARGSASGNRLTLKLTAPTQASTVTYLDSASWSPNKLLYGQNGIAALTFCEVPIDAAEKK